MLITFCELYPVIKLVINKSCECNLSPALKSKNTCGSGISIGILGKFRD